ncbi:hypothetical protein BU15DRAFT_62432 [Melanogaster broomeanus]|nr:hypothetical protein BU15DRAFT_62432 [Melanogaster broomeanus]
MSCVTWVNKGIYLPMTLSISWQLAGSLGGGVCTVGQWLLVRGARVLVLAGASWSRRLGVGVGATVSFVDSDVSASGWTPVSGDSFLEYSRGLEVQLRDSDIRCNVVKGETKGGQNLSNAKPQFWPVIRETRFALPAMVRSSSPLIINIIIIDSSQAFNSALDLLLTQSSPHHFRDAWDELESLEFETTALLQWRDATDEPIMWSNALTSTNTSINPPSLPIGNVSDMDVSMSPLATIAPLQTLIFPNTLLALPPSPVVAPSSVSSMSTPSLSALSIPLAHLPISDNTMDFLSELRKVSAKDWMFFTMALVNAIWHHMANTAVGCHPNEKLCTDLIVTTSRQQMALSPDQVPTRVAIMTFGVSKANKSWDIHQVCQHFCMNIWRCVTVAILDCGILPAAPSWMRESQDQLDRSLKISQDIGCAFLHKMEPQSSLESPTVMAGIEKYSKAIGDPNKPLTAYLTLSVVITDVERGTISKKTSALKDFFDSSHLGLPKYSFDQKIIIRQALHRFSFALITYLLLPLRPILPLDMQNQAHCPLFDRGIPLVATGQPNSPLSKTAGVDASIEHPLVAELASWKMLDENNLSPTSTLSLSPTLSGTPSGFSSSSSARLAVRLAQNPYQPKAREWHAALMKKRKAALEMLEAQTVIEHVEAKAGKHLQADTIAVIRSKFYRIEDKTTPAGCFISAISNIGLNLPACASAHS